MRFAFSASPQSQPIVLWLSSLALRAIVCLLVVIYLFFFLPGTGVFAALTHWCGHVALPVSGLGAGGRGARRGRAPCTSRASCWPHRSFDLRQQRARHPHGAAPRRAACRWARTEEQPHGGRLRRALRGRRAPPLAGPDAGWPEGEGRTSAGRPGRTGDRGRDDRTLVPVADRRPPLAAADPAPWAGRQPRFRRRPSRARSRPRLIEQSELDGAIAAVRAAFETGLPEGRAPEARRAAGRGARRPEDKWPPSALRRLGTAPRRGRGPVQVARHESRWFNLAGFCLRPGTGFPLDEPRIKALWPAFHAGVRHVKDLQCWAEWWILWRRVAAGLNRAHHEEIYRRLVPSCCRPRAAPARRSRPGLGPRRTSWPRCGAVPPAWSGWTALRRRWARH